LQISAISANPIGIAALAHGDAQLFGHGILFNHIGAPRLVFAQRRRPLRGVLSDPGSQAPTATTRSRWIVVVPGRPNERRQQTGQSRPAFGLEAVTRAPSF